MAVGDREGREFVADVFERELEAVREALGVLDGLRAIAKEGAHFGVALEMALGILSEEFAGGVEMSVFANAGKNVEDLPAIRARVLDAVRGDHGQAMLFREIAELLVYPIFAAKKVALDFDVNVFATEDVDEKLHTIHATLESDQPVTKFADLAPPDGAFAFDAAQMRLREQLTQIFVAAAVFHQHGQLRSVFHRQFRADDRPDAVLASGDSEPLRAINAVAIEQCHRRHLQLGCRLG
jgi:hypothetical protein